MRPLLVKLHRWIGLATGLVVFIAGLSGAIFVWEAELFTLANPSLVRVTPQGPRLSADSLVQIARSVLPPDKPVGRLTLWSDSTLAAVAGTQRTNPEARTYFGEIRWSDEVFIDQYTGRVLGTVDRKHHWLHITRFIHTSLLLAHVGEWIVGIATLAFVLMCVIGLVLWWPRTRKVIATRLKPKLNGPWKRTVFDAHNIFGFYGLLGLLVVGITGPVWTWNWYTNAIAWTLTGEARVVAQPTPAPEPGPAPIAAPLETALQSTIATTPRGWRYMIDVPASERRLLVVGVVVHGGSPWEEYERFYYHPASVTLLGDERFEEKNLGMKWRNSNYGIHTGTLYGWPTQVLGTLICLLAASLPVTGALVWYPRWARRRAGGRAGRRAVGAGGRAAATAGGD